MAKVKNQAEYAIATFDKQLQKRHIAQWKGIRMSKTVCLPALLVAFIMPPAISRAEQDLSYIDAGCAATEAATAANIPANTQFPGCQEIPAYPKPLFGSDKAIQCSEDYKSTGLTAIYIKGILSILQKCIKTTKIITKSDHEQLLLESEKRQDIRWTKLIEALREISVTSTSRNR